MRTAYCAMACSFRSLPFLSSSPDRPGLPAGVRNEPGALGPVSAADAMIRAVTDLAPGVPTAGGDAAQRRPSPWLVLGSLATGMLLLGTADAVVGSYLVLYASDELRL